MKSMQEVLGFSDIDIKEAREHGRLLSMEIEFSSRCNLRCSYCYAGEPALRRNELTLEEMQGVISQGKALGVRKIIYVGAGEPTLDSKLKPVIAHAHALQLEHVVFTNATRMDAETARFLYDHDVTVVVKYSSNDEQVFDRLCGCKGSFAAMKRGMRFLKEAGYPDDTHHLGIEAVIAVDNIREIPDLWRWARQNNIIPYMECVTRKGNGAGPCDMIPDKESVRLLFEELARIDKTCFGMDWAPCPPIAGFHCQRHLYSCTINSQGGVQPCVGVGLTAGDIRKEKLANILRNSPVLRDLASIHQTIKGPCRTCGHNNDCYGCRGNAYNLTGDYLASDPTCWRIDHETAPGGACREK